MPSGAVAVTVAITVTVAVTAADDGADDLVAQDPRRMLDRDLAVEQVQVGPADAAGVNLQQQLSPLRGGDRALHGAQRTSHALEEDRPHLTRGRWLGNSVHPGQPR